MVFVYLILGWTENKAFTDLAIGRIINNIKAEFIMPKIAESQKRALFHAKQKRMFKAVENLEASYAGKRKNASPQQRINYLIKNQRAYEATISTLEAEKERVKEVLARTAAKGKLKTSIKLKSQLYQCDASIKALKGHMKVNRTVLERELKE